MNDIEIEIQKEVSEIGLSEIIASLIKENCAQSKSKRDIFLKLEGDVRIVARDAEVSVLLSFKKGRLIIEPVNDEKSADLTIIANSEDIVSLSNIKLIGGYPLLINKEGLKLLKKIFTKGIILKGAINNLGFTLNLLRLFSIN